MDLTKSLFSQTNVSSLTAATPVSYAFATNPSRKRDGEDESMLIETDLKRPNIGGSGSPDPLTYSTNIFKHISGGESLVNINEINQRIINLGGAMKIATTRTILEADLNKVILPENFSILLGELGASFESLAQVLEIDIIRSGNVLPDRFLGHLALPDATNLAFDIDRVNIEQRPLAHKFFYEVYNFISTLSRIECFNDINLTSGPWSEWKSYLVGTYLQEELFGFSQSAKLLKPKDKHLKVFADIQAVFPTEIAFSTNLLASMERMTKKSVRILVEHQRPIALRYAETYLVNITSAIVNQLPSVLKEFTTESFKLRQARSKTKIIPAKKDLELRRVTLSPHIDLSKSPHSDEDKMYAGIINANITKFVHSMKNIDMHISKAEVLRDLGQNIHSYVKNICQKVDVILIKRKEYIHKELCTKKAAYLDTLTNPEDRDRVKNARFSKENWADGLKLCDKFSNVLRDTRLLPGMGNSRRAFDERHPFFVKFIHEYYKDTDEELFKSAWAQADLIVRENSEGYFPSLSLSDFPVLQGSQSMSSAPQDGEMKNNTR